MARTHVDNSGNTMGGNVTLADLASFTFDAHQSDDLTVYEACDLLLNDWPWEVDTATLSLENGSGIFCAFKDGSKLSVSAWADCCDGEGFCPQCWEGRTRFTKRVHYL